MTDPSAHGAPPIRGEEFRVYMSSYFSEQLTVNNEDEDYSLPIMNMAKVNPEWSRRIRPALRS